MATMRAFRSLRFLVVRGDLWSDHGSCVRERLSIWRAAQWDGSSGRSRSSWAVISAAFALSGALGGAVALSDAPAPPSPVLTTDDTVVATAETPKKPRVVILGTGWGGISLLKDLDDKQYDVVVVSPRNYFCFTPLLPSVCSGTVEPRSVTEPVRRIVRGRTVQYYEAECTNIDPKTKTVSCVDTARGKSLSEHRKFDVDYDMLVIAVGCQTNTFGTPGVEQYCHFLKDIDDASSIHEHVIDLFETASLPCLSPEERRRCLNFVIVGGGPTGVEFAAELHDLVYEDLVRLYPIESDDITITVVQAGDHILNTFDERIYKYAEDKFQRDGLNVKTNCMVRKVYENEVEMVEKNGNSVKLPYSLAVWSTGIRTLPLITKFMQDIGQSNRRVLATDEWLRVKGADSVYALGDCATMVQRKIVEDVDQLFRLADTDQNGKLSIQEFKVAMVKLRERYPQIDLYLRSHHLANTMSLLHEAKIEGNEAEVELDIEKFKRAICLADSEMKSNPATAQVAAQQGAYLAKCFNKLSDADGHPEGPIRVRGSGYHRFQPFRYRHLGMFCPLGGEQAAAELPGDWISIGRSSMWLWYSVYLSKQVSWRTRAAILFDWTKRFAFGRDSTRM